MTITDSENIHQVHALIGKNVQFYRQRLVITQKDLAKIVGKSVSTITNIEIGRNTTTIANMIVISNALNVSITKLFKTTEDIVINKLEAIKTFGNYGLGDNFDK